jgi:putative addiction module component (TIGR02574 family)
MKQGGLLGYAALTQPTKLYLSVFNKSTEEEIMSNNEIAAMSILQRLQLMEVLWDSMSDESAGVLDVPLWHRDVLAERLKKIDTGEEEISTWEEAKKRIRLQTEGLQ